MHALRKCRPCIRNTDATNMPLGKKSSHSPGLWLLHVPNPVIPLTPYLGQLRVATVQLEFLVDLVRHLISFGHEHSKWLLGLLPSINPLYRSLVGHSNNGLDWGSCEAALIRSVNEPGDSANPEWKSPNKFFRMLVQELSKELRLPPRLLNWRGHSRLAVVVDTGPLISSRAIRPHLYLSCHGFALDDEEPKAVYEQVIDLAHSGGVIVLWLGGVLEPQAVQNEDVRIIREKSVQIVGHLFLGGDSGLYTWVLVVGSLFEFLDDHRDILANPVCHPCVGQVLSDLRGGSSTRCGRQ